MQDSVRKTISFVGIIGAVVLTIIIFSGIGLSALLLFVIMFLVGLGAALAVSRQPPFYFQPITFLRTAKIGAQAGSVAVAPYLVYGSFTLFSDDPMGTGLGVLMAIFIFILAGIGVAFSAIGGAVGKLWAIEYPASSDKEESHLTNGL